MALPDFPQVEKCPFGTFPAASYQSLISFLSPTTFPFLILFTLKTQPQCPHFPGHGGMLHSPSWLPHTGLQQDPGKEFHGAWEPSLPLFFRLFASQTGADTPCPSGGTGGGSWPPNHSKSIQRGPATLGGLQWLGGLSPPCFVCSVHVPRAFGWLPPVRLHCPVSSQPPGDRMLGFGSCCSVSLSCHCLCPCQRALSRDRVLLTHSQSPRH